MKKVNKKTVFGLLCFLGLASLLVVYLYIYSPYLEQADALDKQTNTIRAQVSQLQQQAQEAEDYQSQMDDMNLDMAALMAKFAAYYQPEDVMLMEYNMVGDTDYVIYGGTSITSPELLYSTGATSTLPEYGMYSEDVEMSITTSYQGLKDIVGFIYSETKIKNISEISFASGQEDGLLNGTITMQQFFLTGTDDLIYEDPVLPSVEFGNDNIFNTLDSFGSGYADYDGSNEEDVVED